ncbi:MAG TPA: hypothetical protein G4O02_17235 [Caldilineae bacterium]|nr:hypothetical protein [Caldilineae bacterium]
MTDEPTVPMFNPPACIEIQPPPRTMAERARQALCRFFSSSYHPPSGTGRHPG